MGVIKYTFQIIPNKTSEVVATHISSFIPSTKNTLLLINEEDEGAISNELVANDRVKLLAINQEMVKLIKYVKHNKTVDSPPVVKNPISIDSILNLPLTSEQLPSSTPLSITQTFTDHLPET